MEPFSDGRSLDPRLTLFLMILLLCNAIPLLSFIAYLFLSGIIIFGSALFVELMTTLFGLAFLLPALFFCTVMAIGLSAVIIAISSLYDATTARRTVKME